MEGTAPSARQHHQPRLGAVLQAQQDTTAGLSKMSAPVAEPLQLADLGASAWASLSLTGTRAWICVATARAGASASVAAVRHGRHVAICPGITDAIGKGLTSADSVGGRVIVPVSFTGGRRYHVMNYQDVMAICRVYGPPDLFVTFTCNPKWKEIVDVLRFEPAGQGSGVTQNKGVAFIHEPSLTPESRKVSSSAKTTPHQGDNLLLGKEIIPTLANVETPSGAHNTPGANTLRLADAYSVLDGSTNKTHKSVTRKTSRTSPSKKAAKKLFRDEGITDDDVAGSTDVDADDYIMGVAASHQSPASAEPFASTVATLEKKPYPPAMVAEEVMA
uniref:Helitron helicase-like domain-containing protein n=1 Tax=Zea mays TaxID=4577 RepID=A0A804Q6J5_MAIZE